MARPNSGKTNAARWTSLLAFTTIPTYPSGQIGFVCCSLDANRSVSTPLRPVPDCKYYNKRVGGDGGEGVLGDGEESVGGLPELLDERQVEPEAFTLGGQYDVIITDSSDPVGPAASLFEAPYFTLLKKALKARRRGRVGWWSP
jgi:hypothetical protein